MRTFGAGDNSAREQQDHVRRPSKTLVQSPTDDLWDVDASAMNLVIRQWQLQLNRIQPVDLVAVLGDVVDVLRQQVDAGGVELRVETASPVTVHADADRLAQILINVVGNSLAYTARGGTVTVSLRIDSANAVVRVADNGRGISQTDLVHIFERFYQVDDQPSTGTGVGLTIARSLARAHGGDVTASSPGLGKGAVFEVILPLEPSTLADQATWPITSLRKSHGASTPPHPPVSD